MIHTICNDYNRALTSIFGNNKRVVFDTYDNDKYFVIRSQEREILNAIEKFFQVLELYQKNCKEEFQEKQIMEINLAEYAIHMAK